MLGRVRLHDALAADDRHALLVCGADAVDDLVALGARTEEHAKVQKVAERRAGADRLDAVDDDALVIGRHDTQGRRVAVRVGARAVGLRIDEMRRADEIVLHRVAIELDDVAGEAAAVGADRRGLPWLRVVHIGDQDVVLHVGRARAGRRHEMLHDEFVVLALANQLLLAVVLEPGHRAADTLSVDKREGVLQVLAAMQVEELGRAPRIVAGERMGRDVVDLLVADPDDASVVERAQIVLAGAQRDARGRHFAGFRIHGRLPGHAEGHAPAGGRLLLWGYLRPDLAHTLCRYGY